MSDAPPPQPESPPANKPSKVVLALLVLNLGATGFATFKQLTAKPAAAAPLPPTPPGNVVGPIHALDPFVVNLDEPGQSRYLKVTLQLELASADVGSAITKSQQLIRDAILTRLSGLKLADTLGVASKEKLRAEILTKLEELLGKGKITRLFFGEFVVQ